MTKVVGVRFKEAGKIYYFAPLDYNINSGDFLIVETVRGIEFGQCITGIKYVNDNDIVSPLKNVIRIATSEDLKINRENKIKEKQAFAICLEKIKNHNLQMKLSDVEYIFDCNKVIFYFTAGGRIDFRDLVKDLASIFKIRIELRQIGVRDESKMIGGIGVCGRTLCCSCFLKEFAPVSIKMAKEQNLSLNTSKISGVCGRFMCCLNYEQRTYEEIRTKLPSINSEVKTPLGRGIVVQNSVVKENVSVKLSIDDDEVIKDFSIYDVEIISGTYEGLVPENEIKLDVEIENSGPEILKDLFDD
ncbi:MAG: stage 0 sporulation family protein [Oscillospiraceae bacterium]|nr:stage 0 sporulation family protein [Oscillospiraceae bacterium]